MKRLSPERRKAQRKINRCWPCALREMLFVSQRSQQMKPVIINANIRSTHSNLITSGARTWRHRRCAIAVSGSAAALWVGFRARELRDLFPMQRLGSTIHVVYAASFSASSLRGVWLTRVSLRMFARRARSSCLKQRTHESRGRRGGCMVYGVDERFWKFHGSAGQAP